MAVLQKYCARCKKKFSNVLYAYSYSLADPADEAAERAAQAAAALPLLPGGNVAGVVDGGTLCVYIALVRV